MPEPTQRSHPEVQPDIHPKFGVTQGSGDQLRAESYDTPMARANPTAQNLSSQERVAGESVERGDKEPQSDAIENARAKEQEGGWKVNRKDNPKNEEGGLRKKEAKKKIPLLVILSLVGGGSIMSFGPSTIADVVMKEIVSNEFNDAATMLDLRKNRLLPVNLASDTTAGICTTKLTVACRYERRGKSFIERIDGAGGKVTCEGPCDKKFNNKIKSITFPPSTKNPDGLTIDDPAKFRSAMIDNPDARSLMNRAYNPVFFSVWDSTAGKVFSKAGITKAKKLTSDDVEENKKAIREAGNIPSVDGKPLIPKHDDPNDPNKITGYTDSSGKNYTVEQGAEISEAAKTILGSTGDVASKVARGVVGTVGAIGAASTACQAIKTIEVVSMGAKTIRTASSILATEPILNSADAKKAGLEKPAPAQAVGEILTERNTDETIIDDNGKKIPNPELGGTAFDGIGMRVVQGFVTNPKLSSSDARFMVGTPTTGVLDKLSRLARSVVNPSLCGAINNPWVQAGSVVAGIAAAIFTGGLSTTQMVAQGAFSAVVSVGMAYAEGMIKDMAAGNMEGNFKNTGVGNTVVVGTSEIHQRIAGARGAGYLTKDNIDDFNSLRAEVRESRVALEMHDAKKDPFNPMLQYSFAGILARQMFPIQLAAAPSSKFLSMAALPFKSLMSILSPMSLALNAKPYDPTRYEVCQDETYKNLGIKADIFCNLRRGMTKEELSRDPVQVGNWMIANNYVDGTVSTENIDVTTLAKGDYKKFLDNCVGKNDIPPGVSEEEGNDKWANQTNCVTPVDIDQNTLSNFRVFTLDFSVIDGMDNDIQSIGAAGGGGSSDGAGELVTGEAKNLARQVANNANIIFTNPDATKKALEDFANTGQAINSCGDPFTIDPMLSGVLLGLSSKYRIYLDNIGFKSDRVNPKDCEQKTSQHLFGKAADINGIEQLGGGKTDWGNLSFSPNELPIITSYANDWLAMLPPDRGGVGQKGCGFTITPPVDAVNVNGSMFFEDSCDHLHIDVRQR